MFLHEFQAKELLARFGIAAPRGRVAASASEAERVARRLGCPRFAIKAQVLAGDRGANGGVLFASDAAEAGLKAGQLLGRPLVTSQTGPSGNLVRLVYIEEAIAVERLLYVATMIDTSAGRLVALASEAGGGEIEDAVARDPSLMHRELISLGAPSDDRPFKALAQKLGLAADVADRVAGLIGRLTQAAIATDAQLIEINPLAVTAAGDLIALDAKIQIDENAMFRQPELASLRDIEAAETGDPIELAAQTHQINYVRLDGEIGVVVNGAGLALATLDLLADAGGRPANFMDIRTTASSQDIAYGFGLILSNARTKAVLVNVHGGGMQRCDAIAEGIAMALRGRRCPVPLVVSFAGNNAEFATVRLEAAGVTFERAGDMRAAARLAVRRSGREAA